MNKFLFSSILNEIYQEILFLTFNYQKETLTEKDINKLSLSDFDYLKKSKNLKQLLNNILSLDTKEYYLDEGIIEILDKGDYDRKSLLYLVNKINPYIEFYRSEMREIEKSISETLNIKLKSEGFSGTWPVYIKLLSDSVTIERAILMTNVNDFLKKETKKFGYKVSYVDYDVKLDDFKFNGKDLRGLEPKEVLKVLDESIKVNLNDSKYYVSDLKEIDIRNERIPLMGLGESSLWLNKKNLTYDGLKTIMKKSMKSTLITLGILVLFTAIMILIKYFK